jgi:hypothetical protein
MCPKALVFIFTNYFSVDWGIKYWLQLSRMGKKLASFELANSNRGVMLYGRNFF